MEKLYDTIIIGGGVAGFGAAMYAGRLGLKTVVVSEIRGGTIILTDIVENYPGFKKLTGLELAQKVEEHAREYGIEVVDERLHADADLRARRRDELVIVAAHWSQR